MYKYNARDILQPAVPFDNRIIETIPIILLVRSLYSNFNRIDYLSFGTQRVI